MASIHTYYITYPENVANIYFRTKSYSDTFRWNIFSMTERNTV